MRVMKELVGDECRTVVKNDFKGFCVSANTETQFPDWDAYQSPQAP
jgi:hypothetical protein